MGHSLPSSLLLSSVSQKSKDIDRLTVKPRLEPGRGCELETFWAESRRSTSRLTGQPTINQSIHPIPSPPLPSPPLPPSPYLYQVRSLGDLAVADVLTVDEEEPVVGVYPPVEGGDRVVQDLHDENARLGTVAADPVGVDVLFLKNQSHFYFDICFS